MRKGKYVINLSHWGNLKNFVYVTDLLCIVMQQIKSAS